MIKGEKIITAKDLELEEAKNALIVLNKSFPKANWEIVIDTETYMRPQVCVRCGSFSVEVHYTYMTNDPFRYLVRYSYTRNSRMEDFYELDCVFNIGESFKKPDTAVRKQISFMKSKLTEIHRNCNIDILLIKG